MDENVQQSAGLRKDNDKVSIGGITPPLTMGPERLTYQFSVSLPQIHLTLVSVLQGVAFSLLLYSAPAPSPAACDIPSLRTSQIWVQGLCGQHFYLAYLISCLAIVLIWMQFVYASLFLVWPLSTLQALLMFLLSLAEVLALRNIQSTPHWLIWLGLVAVVGGFIRLRNLQLQSDKDVDQLPGSLRVFHNVERDNRFEGGAYIALGCFLIGVGLFHGFITAQLSHVLTGGARHYISAVYADGILLVLSLIMIGIVFYDTLTRNGILSDLASDTEDLEVGVRGVLRYRTPRYATVGQTPHNHHDATTHPVDLEIRETHALPPSAPEPFVVRRVDPPGNSDREGRPAK